MKFKIIILPLALFTLNIYSRTYNIQNNYGSLILANLYSGLTCDQVTPTTQGLLVVMANGSTANIKNVTNPTCLNAFTISTAIGQKSAFIELLKSDKRKNVTIYPTEDENDIEIGIS